ncbi:MAG: hypothetical protein U1E81_03200 [Xanthobacteraceae bacterium]
MSVRPDHTDFDFVHREFGPLPPTASAAELADRYRLVQAAALLRLSREGKVQSFQH